MDDQNSVFEECYLKLMQVGNQKIETKSLVEILTTLNGLNYCVKIPFITTWTCTDLLLHLISLLKEYGKDESCLALLCQLIVKVASKQKVVICSMSVNVILHGLKEIWFELLAYYNVGNISKDLCTNLLTAIAAVVYGNGAYIMPEILDWLTGRDGKSGSIGQLLISTVAIDLRKLCLQCLSGLCVPSQSRESLDDDYMHYCLQVFIKMLQTTASVKDVPHYRAIFAAHKGLQYILEGQSGIHVDEIGPLLAILKKHLVFGLATQADDLPSVLTPIPLPSVITPDTVNATYLNGPRPSKKKRKRARNKRSQDRTPRKSDRVSTSQHQAQTSETPDVAPSQESYSLQSSSDFPTGLKLGVTSSESDYSDTEGGQLSALNSFALKIRQMAIGSLYAIIKKTNKVLMLGYWNSFISSASSAKEISLLSCIINDPAPKARVSALMVLSALLEGSKVYLFLGIQKGDSSAFVSFSSMLTSYVHNIHNTLLKALSKERSKLVQVHILKALSTLSANTPYVKIREGFITNIFAKLRPIMVSSHDIDSKIGVLNVYTSLLGNDPAMLSEVQSCITSHNKSASQSSDLLAEPGASTNQQKSWLIEDCFALLSNSSDLPLALHVSVLQLLTTAAKVYFSVSEPYFSELISLMCASIADGSATVRLHAAKLTEEFGASLSRSQQKDKHMIEKGMAFWEAILSGPLQNVVENVEDSAGKSYMCNCLATIGPEIFEKLPHRSQLYCQTLLLGLTSDEAYLVRSSAIRALAIFIMYPVLRKDIAFLEDVARCILNLMKDPVKAVQHNAAWSFGNFTDAIVINVENEPESFSSSVLRKSFLFDMVQCAIESFHGKVRIRFNMMRVLGNILRFCNETHCNDDRFRSLVLQAKTIMVSAILHDPLMKVRWNACLACGNMLRNVHLPLGQPEWTNDVYQALVAAVSSSKNYKVSIKAAIALGCPLNRDAFGDKFLTIYLCVLRSLRNSETNEVDIGEFKFKDKLQEQLLCSLLHLTTMVVVDDVASIVSLVSGEQMLDFLKSKVSKWYNAIFMEHKLASLNLDDVDSDTYAALGQYTTDQKNELYKKASKRWCSVTKNAFDSVREGSEKSAESAAKYMQLFALET